MANNNYTKQERRGGIETTALRDSLVQREQRSRNAVVALKRWRLSSGLNEGCSKQERRGGIETSGKEARMTWWP